VSSTYVAAVVLSLLDHFDDGFWLSLSGEVVEWKAKGGKTT
jgi:hypothetical protein